MSTEIPVQCRHCGALFASRYYDFGGSSITGLTLSGNVEPCIHCGKEANLIEGVFNLLEGALALISGPEISRSQLATLAKIARKISDGSLTADEAVAEAVKADASLKPTANKLFGGKNVMSVALFVLVLFTNKCHLNLDVNLNDLYNQMKSPPHEIQQRYDRSAPDIDIPLPEDGPPSLLI